MDKSRERVNLDEKLRWQIRAALASKKVNKEEVVFLLTRMLPELCDRAFAMGNIVCAFDLAEKKDA